MHLCTENPCPIQDIERLKFLENGYKTTYSMTTLEQFNEEVMKEFKEQFGLVLEDLAMNTGLRYEDDIPEFITQKLTEHKALILKIIKERVPHYKESKLFHNTISYNYSNYNHTKKFINASKEFLNNLDTI